MDEDRETSIHIVISIILSLLRGKQIRMGDDIIAMSEEGHIGYVFKKGNEDVIVQDLTIRQLADLVELYEVIPIPDVER